MGGRSSKVRELLDLEGCETGVLPTFGGWLPTRLRRLRLGHAFGMAAVGIFQGTRRETLSRRATGWMAATAEGAAGFLGKKTGGHGGSPVRG
jgi:hypothetical protein